MRNDKNEYVSIFSYYNADFIATNQNMRSMKQNGEVHTFTVSRGRETTGSSGMSSIRLIFFLFLLSLKSARHLTFSSLDSPTVSIRQDRINIRSSVSQDSGSEFRNNCKVFSSASNALKSLRYFMFSFSVKTDMYARDDGTRDVVVTLEDSVPSIL